jgi:hypothetical protein
MITQIAVAAAIHRQLLRPHTGIYTLSTAWWLYGLSKLIAITVLAANLGPMARGFP